MSIAFSSGNLGSHDVGGLHGKNLPLIEPQLTGKLRSQDRDYAHWEKQIHGLLVLLIKKNLFSADELRHGVEQLEPQFVMTLSYYEKWTMSMILGLIRRKLISRQELEQVFLEWKLDDREIVSDAAKSRPSVFKVGDKVTVIPEAAHRRWRKPHLRIPGYIHGVSGEVTEIVGKFWDPAYTAFMDHVVVKGKENNNNDNKQQIEYRDELKQPLYRVRFLLSDIRHYAPDVSTYDLQQKNSSLNEVSKDYIYLDVFHPWLVFTSSFKKHTKKNNKNDRFFSAPLSYVNKKHHEHEHHDHPHDHKHDDDNNNKKNDDHYHGTRCEIETNAVNKEKQFPLQPLAEAFIYLVSEGKHFVTVDEIRERVQFLDGASGAGKIAKGQLFVAKAWVDPEFRKLLLTKPAEAAKQLGIQTSNYTTDLSTFATKKQQTQIMADDLKEFTHGHTELRVVEDTDEVKNLVCCTLCSCFPASLLGMSPDWYKSRNYRSRCVADPRGLLRDEFGLDLPSGKVAIHVHDSTAEIRYLVLPQRPKTGTEGWTQEQLMKIVTRDSMIGVEILKDPRDNNNNNNTNNNNNNHNTSKL